jgi:hypothetical protein
MRTRTVQSSRLWVVIVLLPLISSCESRDELADLAAAVGQFHAAYNAESFDDIYRLASSAYKREMTPGAHTKLFRGLFDRYGVLRSSARADFSVRGSGAAALVSARYENRFAQDGATEYFAFRYAPGGSRLELMIYERTP